MEDIKRTGYEGGGDRGKGRGIGRGFFSFLDAGIFFLSSTVNLHSKGPNRKGNPPLSLKGILFFVLSYLFLSISILALRDSQSMGKIEAVP